jgi:hypothetical protein
MEQWLNKKADSSNMDPERYCERLLQATVLLEECLEATGNYGVSSEELDIRGNIETAIAQAKAAYDKAEQYFSGDEPLFTGEGVS